MISVCALDDIPVGEAVRVDGGPPWRFRTAESAFYYAASCSFRYSMRTSCGGRYPFAV